MIDYQSKRYRASKPCEPNNTLHFPTYGTIPAQVCQERQGKSVEEAANQTEHDANNKKEQVPPLKLSGKNAQSYEQENKKLAQNCERLEYVVCGDLRGSREIVAVVMGHD